MKVQLYSLEEIFEKKLLLILPFYIFCYKKRFPKIEDDQEERRKLKEEFGHICERLEKLCEAGKLTVYEKHTILNMTRKVVDNLARNCGKIRREVTDSMGGKVLDHETKDILRKGINIGLRTGMDSFAQLVRDGILELSDAARRIGVQEEELAKYL